MSKFNQPGPINSHGIPSGVTPIGDRGKIGPVRINRANPKNKSSETAHSLKNTDVEIYGLAGLKLLQQNQFADAFKLFKKGRHHLEASCLAAPVDLEQDFDLLEQKLLKSNAYNEPVLIAELSLVLVSLLNPLESYQCFAAFSVLADLYAQENQQILADQLAQAFLEAMP